jgi:hypothetical protein
MDHAASSLPWPAIFAAIQLSTALRGQPTRPGESGTGAGKVAALIIRHNVVFEIGSFERISFRL